MVLHGFSAATVSRPQARSAVWLFGEGFVPVLLVPPFPHPTFSGDVRGSVTRSPPSVLSGKSPRHLLTPCLLSHTLLGWLPDTVTELCNVACSSVMPGGGTNLELALHCLHEARGSVQVKWRRGQGQRLGVPGGAGAAGACPVWSAWAGHCPSSRWLWDRCGPHELQGWALV